MMCIVSVIQRVPAPLLWGYCCNVAYCQTVSCNDLNIIIKWVLCKTWDWRGGEEIYVGGGDIFAAFDNASIELLVKSLKSRKTHPRYIAAMIQEMKGLTVEPQFQGIDFTGTIIKDTDPSTSLSGTQSSSSQFSSPLTPCDTITSFTPPLRWNKCIRQGGVESAFSWNNIMSFLLGMIVPAWLQRGYGILLGENKVLTHLVWSDNIYVIGKNLSEFKAMMETLTEVLEPNGLTWKENPLFCVEGGNLEDNTDLGEWKLAKS